ncbi:MAG: hypothetical protein JNM07_14105 [Phycisphaerae bacterium]|nr:hypothetical protein [Phycisphaerae bacterium]
MASGGNSKVIGLGVLVLLVLGAVLTYQMFARANSPAEKYWAELHATGRQILLRVPDYATHEAYLTGAFDKAFAKVKEAHNVGEDGRGITPKVYMDAMYVEMRATCKADNRADVLAALDGWNRSPDPDRPTPKGKPGGE